MSIVSSAFALMAQSTRALAGVPVIYSRGVQSSQLKAVMGQSVWEVIDGDSGLATENRSTDFLILADDLRLGGLHTRPERDDRVVATINGTEHTFQVVPARADQRPWRYTDAGQVQFRIHTNEVEVT